MFDETRHLVASNRQFQDILDVPDDVISSRPTFADYIRYLTDRGECGPKPEDHVAQLLTLGSQPAAFERMRPNGRMVLTRSMRRITELAGMVGAKLRDRSRSVKWRMLEIARAARGKAPPSRDKLKAACSNLLQATGRVVGQAKRFSREIGDGVKHCTAIVQQTALEGQRRVLDMMVPRVQQVMRQTRARIFRGETRSAGKIVSIFEPRPR